MYQLILHHRDGRPDVVYDLRACDQHIAHQIEFLLFTVLGPDVWPFCGEVKHEK